MFAMNNFKKITGVARGPVTAIRQAALIREMPHGWRPQAVIHR